MPKPAENEGPLSLLPEVPKLKEEFWLVFTLKLLWKVGVEGSAELTVNPPETPPEEFSIPTVPLAAL